VTEIEGGSSAKPAADLSKRKNRQTPNEMKMKKGEEELKSSGERS